MEPTLSITGGALSQLHARGGPWTDCYLYADRDSPQAEEFG
jgi:hypothetical protein